VNESQESKVNLHRLTAQVEALPRSVYGGMTSSLWAELLYTPYPYTVIWTVLAVKFSLWHERTLQIADKQHEDLQC
jgi:hypothetical protein